MNRIQDVEPSQHAQGMLQEREIPEEWMWRTIREPDKTEAKADDTIHYIKAIPERGGCFLRVVVNPHVQPRRVVTLFFDRRFGRKT